jgi:hypothetical protein
MNKGGVWRIILAAACGTLAAAALLLSGCPQALDAPTVSYFLEEFEFGKLFITGAEAGKIYTAEIYDYNGSITKYADYTNAVRSDRKLRAGTLASGNAGGQLEIPLENIRGDTAALKGVVRFVSVMENDGERVKTFYKAGVFFDNDGRAAVSLAAMTEALFPVTLGNLTDLLESPRAGARPNPYFTAAEEYTGSGITWTRVDDGPMDEFFLLDIPYQAEVTLIPAKFFTFNALNNGQNDAFFSYDGAESVTYTPPDPDAGGSVTVTIGFSVTVVKPVDYFDLSSYFPSPVKGSPVKTTTENPPQSQYTGKIVWKTSNVIFEGNAFDGSTVYQAEVTLKAEAGYTFTGVKADSFKYDYAKVEYDAGSGDTITITVTFPATEPSDVVTDLTLTGRITAPVAGAAPVKSGIDTEQYTGKIVWKNSNGTPFAGNAFAGSTVYRAEVTLTAKPGFTFTGVPADGFTYTGATATNAANSGTVIITFPATAAPGAGG